MNKPPELFAGSARGSRSAADGSIERGALSEGAVGTVRCFVDPEELRRLLSVMAGIELVSVLLGHLASP